MDMGDYGSGADVDAGGHGSVRADDDDDIKVVSNYEPRVAGGTPAHLH